MHHYRQALLRMRQGDSDRDIADAKIMGRRKAAQWRALAQAHGWLDAQALLPDDEAVAAALQPPKRASTTVSSLEEHRAKVASWVEQNVPGTAIHQALQRQHDWRGSYSAVRRMVAGIRATLPPEVTCRLDFAPGEAAQVDFGAAFLDGAREAASGWEQPIVWPRLTDCYRPISDICGAELVASKRPVVRVLGPLTDVAQRRTHRWRH